LNWHHIEPLYLPPPDSPDFNPIERFWQHLKSQCLVGYIMKHWKELNEKLYQSIKALHARPDTIRSVCNTHTS
jgi:transposase